METNLEATPAQRPPPAVQRVKQPALATALAATRVEKEKAQKRELLPDCLTLSSLASACRQQALPNLAQETELSFVRGASSLAALAASKPALIAAMAAMMAAPAAEQLVQQALQVSHRHHILPKRRFNTARLLRVMRSHVVLTRLSRMPYTFQPIRNASNPFSVPMARHADSQSAQH